MKMFAIILGVIVVAIAGLLIYASGRPDEFSITRSTLINARPEKVYSLLDDFKLWTKWSPFETPDLKRSYGVNTKGDGATYAWEGGQSGSGNMVIDETTPPSQLAITLNMTAPVKSQNKILFTVTPEGAGSRVSWMMSNHETLLFKVVHVFMNPEAMMGPIFDQGLAKLKAEAEAQS
jgi:uncharacterized protein YndB with AHSA1/START domain